MSQIQPLPLPEQMPLPIEIHEVLAGAARMREWRPVAYDTRTGLWDVFRYDDVERVLTDYAHFSSEQAMGGGGLSESLIAMDPPRHRQLRALITQAFTPRAVARLEPRIRAITQQLLDQVRHAGTMDLIADLAYPLPAIVIAELLGVPSAERDTFKRWSDAIITGDDGRATQEMGAYCAKLLRARQHDPQDDLISALLGAEIDGQHLSERELVGFCILLLIAGHETTTNLIGNAILCLDAFPEAMERLRCEPALMPRAIEEVLRYLPPVWEMYRYTTMAVEVGGQRLPAGQPVRAWIVSGNRDARKFDAPDTFDIAREPNRHLSFGHGIHFCIGAPLARLEAAIALPMILAQLPDLRSNVNAPLEVLGSSVVFGVRRLPVAFTPTTVG